MTQEFSPTIMDMAQCRTGRKPEPIDFIPKDCCYGEPPNVYFVDCRPPIERMDYMEHKCWEDFSSSPTDCQNCCLNNYRTAMKGTIDLLWCEDLCPK